MAGGFAISGALFIFVESVGKKDGVIASMRAPGAAVIGLGLDAGLRDARGTRKDRGGEVLVPHEHPHHGGRYRAIAVEVPEMALRFLLSFFVRHTLRPFAYYCFFASAIVFGLLLLEV